MTADLSAAQHLELLVAQDTPAAADPAGWVPVDLTGHLDGTHKPERPALLHRTDGVPLAYPGRIHWASGEPEAGKSWFGILAVAQVLTAGQRAVYVDLEDGPGGIVQRLLSVGATPDSISGRFAYVSPDGPLRYAARAQLTSLVSGAALVVIDACTEALSLQGLSSKDDVDIATWLNLLPRWAAKHGPAVLVLDHVVKDRETRGRWATGSQHKLAGVDGAAYLLDSISAGGQGQTSRSRVYEVKDRHGQVRPHTLPGAGGQRWLADLVIDSTGPFTDVALQPPHERTEQFLPTAVMEKVATALTGAPGPLSTRGIRDRVTAKTEVVGQAVAALTDLGYITTEPGPRGAVMHTLTRPYPTPEEAP